jgi:hypothetical protein
VRPLPDIDAFEERAAIAQFEGGLSRRQAEEQAAREQGFATSDDYWSWLADYVVARRVPD